jgi:hypothetical protein
MMRCSAAARSTPKVRVTRSFRRAAAKEIDLFDENEVMRRAAVGNDDH